MLTTVPCKEVLKAVDFRSYPCFRSGRFLSWSEKDGEKSVQLFKLSFLLLLLIDSLLFLSFSLVTFLIVNKLSEFTI